MAAAMGVIELEAALRRNAEGVYALESAVEFLIRTGWHRRLGGDLVRCEASVAPAGAVVAWVEWAKLRAALDAGEAEWLGASGGELRNLRLACLLAGEVGDSVGGQDRREVALFLAAVAHASGSHEHSGEPVPDPGGRYVNSGTGERFSFPGLGTLYPWP